MVTGNGVNAIGLRELFFMMYPKDSLSGHAVSKSHARNSLRTCERTNSLCLCVQLPTSTYLIRDREVLGFLARPEDTLAGLTAWRESGRTGSCKVDRKSSACVVP